MLFWGTVERPNEGLCVKCSSLFPPFLFLPPSPLHLGVPCQGRKKARSDFPGQEKSALGQLKIWMFGGLVSVADPDFELQVEARFCFTFPAGFSSFSHFFFFHPK